MPSDLAEFRVRVRPSPGTNDHEVCLLANDEDLVDLFAPGLMGLDPDDLLIEPCGLRADTSHLVLVGRCSCGIAGCDSVEVRIRTEGDRFTWESTDSARRVQFRASQYAAEVVRALHDRSWETPDRTAARLIAQSVDRTWLTGRGFEFSWASGRCMQGMMTAAFVLTPGPYEVLVNLPWDGEDVRTIVAEFKKTLSQPPETWPNLQCYPQAPGLLLPPIAGSGWK
jgi:hypothetical protein